MTAYVWQGIDGDWDTAADWLPSALPGGNDDVSILTSGIYTLTVSDQHFANTLHLGASAATLAIAGPGASLAVSGFLNNEGTIVVDGGATFSVLGPFLNRATIEIQSGGVMVENVTGPIIPRNTGIVEIASGGRLQFGGALNTLGTLEIGTIQAAPGASIAFTEALDNFGSTFTSSAGVRISGTIFGGTIAGTLDVGDEIDNTLILEPDNFTGAGGVGAATIDVTGDGSALFLADTIANVTIDIGNAEVGSTDYLRTGGGIGVTFDKTTTIQQTGLRAVLNGGTFNARFANQGSIVVGASGGVFALDNATLDNSGSIDVAQDASFVLENALSFINTGTITGAGTLSLDTGNTTFGPGATVAIANVSESGSGTILIIADTVNYAGNFTEGRGSHLIVASDDQLELSGTSSLAGTIVGNGALALSGGDTTIAAGAGLFVAHWSISGAGTQVTTNEPLAYAGAFSLTTGATLSLATAKLVLTGGADLSGATVNGSKHLFTEGATDVSGLTIGGTAVWINDGAATQSGGDLVLRDASGGVAILYNSPTGVYDIADDSGVGLGASASSYINNGGQFEKTGGAGTSVIAANMYNAGTIEVADGTLDFHGALWGPGRAEVGAGATLVVDGEVGGRSMLAFSGAGGVISLDDLDAAGVNLFHGRISGFGAGDAIDVGAPFGIGTTARFAEFPSGAGGELILRNGALRASVAMLGDYATGNFTPSDDGHGGTLLTFHT